MLKHMAHKIVNLVVDYKATNNKCLLYKFENNKVIVNINYFLIKPHSSCSLAMKLGIKY
jgi:hypothetical protein